MILISHRGNIDGPLKHWENEPTYIDLAISKGYDVEIDVWCLNDKLYLGHDLPQYYCDNSFFNDRIEKLWVHCKNLEALIFFITRGCDFNYFWHENDKATLTSKNYIWTFPRKIGFEGTISVLPERFDDYDVSKCMGVCSDFISKFK